MQLDKFEDFPSLADINSLESSKKSKTNSTAKTTDSSTQSVATKSVGTQKRDFNDGIQSEYGMLGLMNQLKQSKNPSAARNKFLSSFNASNNIIFAPGIELTHLGIDLDRTENIFTSFMSPFSTTSEDPPLDSFLPTEYALSVQQKEAMSNCKIDTLGDQSLIYLFYTHPNDYLQLVTATVLHKRGWHYFKPTQFWFKKINDESVEIFDPDKWQKTIQNINVIDWDRAEVDAPLNYAQVENLWLGSQNQLLQKRDRMKYPGHSASGGSGATNQNNNNNTDMNSMSASTAPSAIDHHTMVNGNYQTQQ